MISPVIFFNLVMGIIGSFQVFTSAFIMTKGGPANATYFFVLGIYLNAFQFLKMGVRIGPCLDAGSDHSGADAGRLSEFGPVGPL